MTLYTINGRGSHRLKSPALPIRQTLNEANADLAEYAKKHGFIPDDEDELDTLTQEIIRYKNQTAQNFIEIGKRLKKVKEKLAHGEWLNWLRDKVEFSRYTATRLIQCADEFSNVAPAQHLSLSKMIELLALPAEKRDKFIKNNDVKKMSKRQLRQAVKAEKNAEKIITTATIETIPNQSPATDLPIDTAAKIDVQPDLPVIDDTYSKSLIQKIKSGYVSYKTAAEIAHEFPGDTQKQEQAMIEATMQHQQAIAEMDEDARPHCAFVMRHIYKFMNNGEMNEANVYTAMVGDKHYLIEITCWNAVNDHETMYPYPRCLNFYKSMPWDIAYDNGEDAKHHGTNMIKTYFNISLIEVGVTNFTLEITPEIAAAISKSITVSDNEPEQLPLEVILIQEKLIAKFKNSRELFLENYASDKSLKRDKIYADFYTLIINYLQNVDAYTFKKIMEEENG